MKRFALLPLLFLLACEGSPVSSPDPQVNSATLQRSAPICEVSPYHRIDGAAEPLHGSGARFVRDYTVKFYTTCTSDVNVKVYFIQPIVSGYSTTDGRRVPVADVDAPVFDADDPHGILRFASFRVIVPKDQPTYPDGWNPKFFVEVRAGGALIGSFFTVDDGTPDYRFAN